MNDRTIKRHRITARFNPLTDKWELTPRAARHLYRTMAYKPRTEYLLSEHGYMITCLLFSPSLTKLAGGICWHPEDERMQLVGRGIVCHARPMRWFARRSAKRVAFARAMSDLAQPILKDILK